MNMISVLSFFLWMILLLLALFGAMMVALLKLPAVPDNMLWVLVPSIVVVGVLFAAARFLEATP